MATVVFPKPAAGQPNGETFSRGRDTFLKLNGSSLITLDRMGIGHVDIHRSSLSRLLPRQTARDAEARSVALAMDDRTKSAFGAETDRYGFEDLRLYLMRRNCVPPPLRRAPMPMSRVSRSISPASHSRSSVFATSSVSPPAIL
jgi:hypothetical protein